MGHVESPLQHTNKRPPATRQRPGVWTAEIGTPWPSRPYHRARRLPSFAGLLDSPEIAGLVSELEATRWTGRPGYRIRAMVGMALAKSMYAIPTWTRTVALVRGHAALRGAIAGDGDVPSVYAVYRFAAKLRRFKPLLDACLDRVLSQLRLENPEVGRDVAIDGSDLPLRERAAVRLEERPRARAVLRPGRLVGPPLGRLHAQGRRVLRLQGPRRRLRGRRTFRSLGPSRRRARPRPTLRFP
jgi:hypothetical protein